MKLKKKTKKQEGGSYSAFLALLTASVVQPGISLVVKSITIRGVMRAGGECYNNM